MIMARSLLASKILLRLFPRYIAKMPPHIQLIWIKGVYRAKQKQ